MSTEIRDRDAAVPTPAPSPAAQAVTPPAARLRWLDALRGIAVLAVVYEHFAAYLFPGVKQATVQWVHAGTFGVVLFFLVSGYIVPASIERRGSLRHFWIGRVFRLYPAFLITIAGAAVVAQIASRPGVPQDLFDKTMTTVLGHLTMLQDILGVANVQYQFWTLTYEMLFYLIVTVVFVFGVHRFSAEIALLLSAAAIALGSVLPVRSFAGDPLALRNLVLITGLVLLVGVTAVSSRRRAIVVAGAVLLGSGVLVLLGGNQAKGGWEGFVILAVMFTGTALYRAEQGQISRWRAAPAVVAVLAATVIGTYGYGNMWNMVGKFPADRSWTGGLLLAFAVFGLGMALRRQRVPGWLSWIGAISYSVYLLHYLVLALAGDLLRGSVEEPLPLKLALTAGYLAAVLGVSWLCYRLVELPFQSMGRNLSRRMDGQAPKPASTPA
ncbi:acyltransferase family protein [Actinoplanes xinjiangensis]|uniref:acyltransferase family protein n=1 Tax=Actinoplanes xinjiangensis TaxID=512350 RepID=UPI00343D14FB